MRTIVLFFFLLLLVCAQLTYSQPCALTSITTNSQLVLPTCFQDDGSIILIETRGGVAPYRFTLGAETNRTGVFPDLPIGDYTFAIKDARGCPDTVLVRLQYDEIDNIIRPDNAFTPNGDGLNDLWRISGIRSFFGSEVRVFNRWGQLVHVNTNYDNDLGWDGTQNGSDLPPATYYYIIAVVNNCIEEYVNGTVTIVR